jgi:ankyrin repeat protein
MFVVTKTPNSLSNESLMLELQVFRDDLLLKYGKDFGSQSMTQVAGQDSVDVLLEKQIDIYDQIQVLELITTNLIIARVFDHGEARSSRAQILARLNKVSPIDKSQFGFSAAGILKNTFDQFVFRTADLGSRLLSEREQLESRISKVQQDLAVLRKSYEEKMTILNLLSSDHTQQIIITQEIINSQKVSDLKLIEASTLASDIAELDSKHKKLCDKIDKLREDPELIEVRETALVERPWYDLAGLTRKVITYNGDPFEEVKLKDEPYDLYGDGGGFCASITGHFSPSTQNAERTTYKVTYYPDYFSKVVEVTAIWKVLKRKTQSAILTLSKYERELEEKSIDLSIKRKRASDLHNEIETLKTSIQEWKNTQWKNQQEMKDKKISELKKQTRGYMRMIVQLQEELGIKNTRLSEVCNKILDRQMSFDVIESLNSFGPISGLFDKVQDPAVRDFITRYRELGQDIVISGGGDINATSSIKNRHLDSLTDSNTVSVPSSIDTNQINDLFDAIVLGNIHTIQRMIDMKSPSINGLGSNGYTPLHQAVKSKQSEVLKLLLGEQVSKNCQDSNGNTPLYLASETGWLEGVKILLKSGADMNQANDQMNTPLHASINNCHRDVVKTLLKSKANIYLVNKKGNMCVHVAAQTQNPPILQVVLDHANPKCFLPDLQGDSPLHLAAEVNYLENDEPLMLQMLINFLDRKVWGTRRIDRTDKIKCLTDENSEGNTFFHKAVKEGKIETTRWILSNKILDLSLYNRGGDTPLHIAIKECKPTMVDLLLQYEPQLQLRNSQRKSVFDVAHDQMSQCLETQQPNYDSIVRSLNNYKLESFLGQISVNNNTRQSLRTIFRTNLRDFIDTSDWPTLCENSDYIKRHVREISQSCKSDNLNVIMENKLKTLLSNITQNNLALKVGLASLDTAPVRHETARTRNEKEFIQELSNSIDKYYYISYALLEQEVQRNSTRADKIADSIENGGKRMLPLGMALGAGVNNFAPLITQAIGQQIGMSGGAAAAGLGVVIGLAGETIASGISRIIKNVADRNALIRVKNVVETFQALNTNGRLDTDKTKKIATEMMLRYRDQINDLDSDTDVSILANYISQKIIDHVVAGLDRTVGEPQSIFVKEYRSICKRMSGSFNPNLESDIVYRCLSALKRQLPTEDDWKKKVARKGAGLERRSWYVPGIVTLTSPKICNLDGKCIYYTDGKQETQDNYETYGFYYASPIEIEGFNARNLSEDPGVTDVFRT